VSRVPRWSAVVRGGATIGWKWGAHADSSDCVTASQFAVVGSLGRCRAWGAVTHNDATSIASCVAFVGMLWELLGMSAAPGPEWWLKAFVARARPLEGEVQLQPRHSGLAFRGPLWRMVDTEVRRALEQQLTVRDACDRWYSGAFLLETVPSALYILARHSEEPEEAILRAVDDTKDNDTIAAIVGAAVGALHGRVALPARWVDGLLGRTREDDDGRVFELIAQARTRWG
jgi:ADP-ribosyl-[dinitrogen reductase] hydrolase